MICSQLPPVVFYRFKKNTNGDFITKPALVKTSALHSVILTLKQQVQEGCEIPILVMHPSSSVLWPILVPLDLTAGF